MNINFPLLRKLLLLCLLVSACGTHDETTQESESGLETINVTLTEGTNMAAALSPDKTTLALDLQGTIWVMPVGGGSAAPITDAMGDCHEPAWSPDGEWIAFHSYKSGNYHIWMVRKDGSELRQLTDGVYDDREPDWMPDGNRIVFSSDRNGNYDIFQMDITSGAIESLTTNEANDYNPTVSADGTQIAFVSEREKEPGIYKLNHREEELVAPFAVKLAAPSWSADDTKVLFTAYDGGTSTMHQVDLATHKVSPVTTADEDIFPFRTSWLTDSTFIYTADGKIKKRIIGDEGFETISFEGVVTLTRNKYTRKKYDFDSQEPSTPLGIMGPVVSPDGKKVAFTALGDLYIQEIGGETTAVTRDRFVDLDPDWSPDGTQLAFVSDRSGKMDIWIKDLQTGKEWQLTELTDNAGFPAWSPDGTRLAFFAVDARNVWGRGILSIVDVASGEVESIYDPLFVPGKPTWSPDEKTLALMALDPYSSRYREGISKILLLSLADGSSRFVTPTPHRTPAMRGKNGPIWSPDGKSMAYIEDGVLWTVPVAPDGEIVGEPQQITKELAAKPSWSGDGKSIVYIATDHLKKVNLEDGSTEDIEIALEWTSQLSQENYIVHAGKLFDGLSAQYLEDVDIIVEGHRIKDIVPHQAERSGQVIDASDKVVIPGLFEMHTHQHNSVGEKLGRTWLAYGITSVREPGADPYDALERKESWASGIRPGPREFFTGGLTDGGRVYYGLANSIIHGPHMELEMERAKRLGYDLIKTYVRMSDSLQERITQAAHEIGIPVSSHEIYPAMKYNVDAVEHIRGTSRRGYSLKQTELRKTYDDVVQLLSRSGMSITPTIGLQGGFFLLAQKDKNIMNNPQFQRLYSEKYRADLGNAIPRLRTMFPGFDANFEEIQKSIKAILNAGGKITAGTDSPFIPYGTSLHVELQLFVEGGFTPYQALQTATVNAAEAIGVAEDLGSVEPGKLADFVIVEGDPLANIQDAWNVQTVFKNGIKYEIDQLLTGP